MNARSIIQDDVRASALLLLECLSTQSNAGVNWEVLHSMEPALAALMPLRRTVRPRWYQGMQLLDVVRTFSLSAAQELLRRIQYPEFIQDLHNLPYNEVQGKFIQRCAEYSVNQLYTKR